MRFFTLLLAVLLLVAAPAVAGDQLFTPHIERHSNGWIDWDNGYIYGTGRAFAADNGNKRSRTIGAAQLVAAANIVKLASGLHLDNRHTLEKLGHGTFILKLKAFLRYRTHQQRFVQNSRRPYAEVTLVTPMRGVEGLTAAVLKQLKGHPLQWQKYPLPDPVANMENSDAPWLVIDTRQLPRTAAVQPSLFPKITSSSGQTLYDLNKVYSGAHALRGMARYVHSNASAAEIVAELRHQRQPQEQPWWQQLLPGSNAWARPRRQRPRYIVATAQQVRGIARTNLVISNRDAEQLRREDEASKILKNCRVIIITSAPIGGIEGEYLPTVPLRICSR